MRNAFFVKLMLKGDAVGIRRSSIAREKLVVRFHPGRTAVLIAVFCAISALLAGAQVSRGDAAATLSARLVKDINPGTSSSNPASLVAVGGTVFFQATDGVHGIEFWKSDGTVAGTAMLKDINPAGDSSPAGFTVIKSTVYFRATDGTHGVELWKTDGTDAGTVMVSDVNSAPGADSNPEDLVAVNNSLFFAATDSSHGRELWKSDGTATGTVMVKDINPSGGSDPSSLTAVSGSLYFSASDGAHGQELWKSDGTAAGTAMVKDINPSGNSGTSSLTAVGGSLFFSASDGTNGRELWKSDGTATDTVMVKDINPSGDSDPSSLTAVGGSLYFTLVVPETPFMGPAYELWKSDGTEAGTVIVTGVGPCISLCSLDKLAAVGSKLYFEEYRVDNPELWKSDGTEAGTVRVRLLEGGIDQLTAVGVSLFFSLLGWAVPVSTDELWRSDGTDAGTVLVMDVHRRIDSGKLNSKLIWLTAVGNSLYFSADDGTHGAELWRTGDFSPPQTKITKHPKKTVYTKKRSATVRFGFASDESGSTFTCKLDSGKWKPCNSPKSVKVKASKGKHTFRVRATDKFGNADGTPAKWVWRVKRK